METLSGPLSTRVSTLKAAPGTVLWKFACPPSSSTGTTGIGIRIDGGASQIEIEKTQLRSINGTSIALPGPASHVRISGVVIDHGTSHGISVGTGVTDLSVEDAAIGSTGGAGIHLEGESTSSSGPVLIRHNNIYMNKVGIDVVSGMGQVTIGTRRDAALPCSNIIWGDRDGAILVRDPAARVRISENAMQPIRIADLTPNEYAIPINLKPDGEAAGAVTDNDPLDGDSGPTASKINRLSPVWRH